MTWREKGPFTGFRKGDRPGPILEPTRSSPHLIEGTRENPQRPQRMGSTTRDQLEETEILHDLALEEADGETLAEVRDKLGILEKKLTQMEFTKLLSGENDINNAIVAIHAGAGGTEAQDWAEMLLRMYLRWAEMRNYKTEVIDMLPGDEAGTKNVTFTVEGKYAYGYLRSESGIHRLVRISPFDAGGRRHTSFASVFVYPEGGRRHQYRN